MQLVSHSSRSAHGAFDESQGTAYCDRVERIAYLVARGKLLAQFMQVGRLAKGGGGVS
jgi:hypothetical protein